MPSIGPQTRDGPAIDETGTCDEKPDDSGAASNQAAARVLRRAFRPLIPGEHPPPRQIHQEHAGRDNIAAPRISIADQQLREALPGIEVAGHGTRDANSVVVQRVTAAAVRSVGLHPDQDCAGFVPPHTAAAGTGRSVVAVKDLVGRNGPNLVAMRPLVRYGRIRPVNCRQMRSQAPARGRGFDQMPYRGFLSRPATGRPPVPAAQRKLKIGRKWNPAGDGERGGNRDHCRDCEPLDHVHCVH